VFLARYFRSVYLCHAVSARAVAIKKEKKERECDYPYDDFETRERGSWLSSGFGAKTTEAEKPKALPESLIAPGTTRGLN